MFKGTKKGFHCMDCGRSLPERQIICKSCLKEHQRRGESFEMTRSPPASERMEHLQ